MSLFETVLMLRKFHLCVIAQYVRQFFIVGSYCFLAFQEDAFLVGPNVLVAPVLSEGSTNVLVTLPGSDLWYDYTSLKATQAPAEIDVHADMDSIPVFYRGGSIIPTKHRIRRSSVLARDDPLTLIVAPNKNVSSSSNFFIVHL